jgi:hypothetical protein
MMHHPNAYYDWDGIRAGNTIKWLEQSGPRYHVQFVQVLCNDIETVRVRDDRSVVFEMTAANVSFASWVQLSRAACGARLSILVRIDPVGRPQPV